MKILACGISFIAKEQTMTKVNCWLDDCKCCKDGVCTAEEIELYDDHVCDGGCDDGWLMERRADDE